MIVCLRPGHTTCAMTAGAAVWNMQYCILYYMLQRLPLEIIQQVFSLMLPVLVLADGLQLTAWHGGTQRLLWSRACKSRLLSVKTSVSGQYMAYITVSCPFVYVWDLWQNKEHGLIPVHAGICLDFEFDNTEQAIYILRTQQMLQIAQLQKIMLTDMSRTVVTQYEYASARLALSPNGKYIGFSKAVWHNQQLTKYFQHAKVDDYIYLACFSPDNLFFVSGCKVDTFGLKICVWDTNTGQLVCSLKAMDRIKTCAFSLDGTLLVLGNGSATSDIYIYETRTWNLRRVIATQHENAITNIWFVQSLLVITTCLNGLVCLINLK